jgi:RecJ-like exonuclease
VKIKLNVSERLATAQFLPKESSISEQVIGKNILDKTKLSQEERKKIRFDAIYQGQIAEDTDFTCTIDFNPEEHDLLYNEVLQQDKDKKINQSNISLAIKIRDAKNSKS